MATESLPNRVEKPVIRRAEPGDQAACAEVFVAGYRQAYPVHPAVYYQPHLYYTSIIGEEQWVALVKDELCAVLSIYWPENFIHSLYVAPHWQSCGIGSQLLDTVMACGQGVYELKCDVANVPALVFYSRRGWQPAGEGVGENGPWIRFRL